MADGSTHAPLSATPKARLRPPTTGSDNLEALLPAACTQVSELLGKKSKLSAGTVAIAQSVSRQVEVTSGNRLSACIPISPMPQTTSGQEQSLVAPCPRGSTVGFRSFRDENAPASLPWTTPFARDGDPEPVNRQRRHGAAAGPDADHREPHRAPGKAMQRRNRLFLSRRVTSRSTPIRCPELEGIEADLRTRSPTLR